MLPAIVKEVARSLWPFLYPEGCLLCGGRCESSLERYLCDGCLADLHSNEQACARCALPVNEPGTTLLCADCLKSPPGFDQCLSAYVYAQPLEWMIQQLKFNEKLSYSPLLSSLMLGYLQTRLPSGTAADAIIPMPLHPNRLKERGFNQSQLLAKPVSIAMNILMDTGSCQRVRDTPHQTGKTARQRQQNIKAAFQFDNKKNYQHVIIFDDVITTGSSVIELTKVLKRSGVKRVDVWSLARAAKRR